jgi:hypothetical protein
VILPPPTQLVTPAAWQAFGCRLVDGAQLSNAGPTLQQLLHTQLQHHFGDAATAGANNTVQGELISVQS